MRKYFWNHVVPSNDKETIGGVCYDIRDAVSFRVADICSEIEKKIIYLLLFLVQLYWNCLERKLQL